MEFHEKLQALRHRKGLTQEQLAQALFVSRTAISKWESGRGYPNLDSLKALARFYDVTVDALLSGDQVLTIAEQSQKERQSQLRELVFSLLDVGAALLLFLPLFGQRLDGASQTVSLFALTRVAPYLRGLYLAVILAMVLWGITALALSAGKDRRPRPWKCRLSLGCNGAGVLLFILSPQPYAAAILFLFLIIKLLLLAKKG